MRRLLIVWHSMTGGARAMAEAAADAARGQEGVETILRRADATDAGDVLAADAYLFVTPENLAAIAGLMKDFFDRCYYPALGRIEGRAYAQMVCAGSDGTSAARQIERIAKGWRLRAVADPLILLTHAQTPEAIAAPKIIAPADLDRCRDLGAAIAGGLALGIY
ncbi:flavodoxin family protein [Sphingomonas sp.]|uniref:flavodoxin family protein n=1 Tax=Sphingomonas sp. TaxID=28214 RepID=UPI000DB498F2|nr:NAD(P)H-dependent oxidoreductase [Sphingomonas sp.]PZU07015.1 MAG: flavodoxin [Sphingomonas sp.]